MRLRSGLAGAALALLPLSVALAQTPPAMPSQEELLRRLEAAENRLKVLERQLEIQKEEAATAAASAPQVRASANRFSIGTADGSSFVRLRGVLHIDGRHFEGDGTPATSNTWLLRRVRPIVEGSFANIYDFRFTPDFAQGRTVIQDAFVTARFRPWAAVTVGKFKVPIGLERIQSATDLRFIERGFPTGLVPNRDIGVQLGGEWRGGLISYNVGYTNGVLDGGSAENNVTPDGESDAKGDVNARVFFQPFLNSDNFALRGLGFGVGGTYVDSTGSATNTLLTSYRTPGQATFFSYRASAAAAGATPAVNGAYASGERLRLSPQFYYYYNNIGLLGESVRVSQDVSRLVGTTLSSTTLDNSAWQLQFSWLLTGEEQTFRSPNPAQPFQLGKPGWGAWELVARVQELTIDDDAFSGGAASFANPATSAHRAKAAGIGLNWYLNQNVKWQLNYDFTTFDGGAASGDRPDEQAYFTRIGLSF
jgi:phosphate-selective porin OprO and OprP